MISPKVGYLWGYVDSNSGTALIYSVYYIFINLVFSYFTAMNVRHPLARLYSAWRDKFRKEHPWMVYIQRKPYSKYLDILERRDMTNEDYVYSFEAFAEVLALQRFDSKRDKHWQSMSHYCSPCQAELYYMPCKIQCVTRKCHTIFKQKNFGKV